ncbi:MAG: winged helix-turn-helix domain-containing protein [Thiotrichales bacterium]|nr:MAG: winged helix-turn-helix domain-containing protein [Thiotrichales bacterium]
MISTKMTTQNDIKTDAPFWVGDCYVDPETGRIQRDGHEQKIEPKAMAVLACLAQNSGHVVTRDQIEETAWAGVVVGYDSLASAIIKLRKAFNDDSRKPRVIETVPKKGYRLIAPVCSAEGGITPENVSLEDEPVAVPAMQNRRKLFALVLIVLLAIPGLLLFIDKSPENRDIAVVSKPKPAIAVLPFKNLSNDTEQEYFSDGITADLITDLSKLSGLSVIARNSVFTYKNTDVDVREVGKELGVNYILEGSIRKAGNQVRISARLIDTSNSYNVWAERFDGTLDNVFGFQDEVTSKIISSLEIRLTDKDRTRLAHKYSNSIEAYDMFLHGWQNLWLSSREGVLRARDDFRKAIDLDNSFARAYANLALTYIYDHMHGWSDESDQALQQAHVYADRAIAIDPELPQVHWVKGFADIFSRDYQKALRQAERSIELDPNFADGYGLLGNILNYAGKPRQAALEMQKAMRLNPRHPFIYKVIYGEILFNQRDYDNAIENFTLALDSNPEIEESRLWLAAALAHVGRVDDASWQLEQIRMAGSDLSLERIERVVPFKDPEQRKHLIDGLYKAGLVH